MACSAFCLRCCRSPSRTPSSTFCSTLLAKGYGFCGMYATRNPSGRTICPPFSGESVPAKMRSSVDLPAPLPPMMHVRTPGAKAKRSMDSTVRVP